MSSPRAFPFPSLLACSVLLAAAPASADELLWSQGIDGMTIVESHRSTAPIEDIEAADDFELDAAVERVFVLGHLSFNQTQEVAGARLAFYEWTAGGPGRLQQETLLSANDPNLIYEAQSPQTFQVVLPQAFQASGRHFVSFQILSDAPAAWRWWTSHTNAATLSEVVHRTNGGAWSPIDQITGVVHADLAFELYGTDATPPPPSTDPCGTWVVDGVPLLPNTHHSVLRDVVAIAADDVWAVDNPFVGPSEVDGTLRASTVHWDGTSWTRIATPHPSVHPDFGAGLWGVDALAADDVWAAGYQTLQDANGFVGAQGLVMRWDGAQWNVLPSPRTDLGYSGAFARGVEAIVADDVWIVGDYPGSGGQLPMLFHWDGSSIQQVPLGFSPPGPVGMEAASASGPDDVWTVGGGGDGDDAAYSVIFHWDGSGWEYVPGPTPGIFSRLNDVEALAPDDVWATGGYFDGTAYHVLMLHWDGSSWTQVPGPAGSLGLTATAAGEVYSVGGGVYRWNGSEWEVVEDFHSEPHVALAAIDEAGPCELFAVGRSIPGDITAFAAHVLPGAVVSYCNAEPNSTGQDGRMAYLGEPVVAQGDFTLLAQSLPPNRFGYFLVSATQGFVAKPGGSQGTLCLGGTIGRYAASIGSSGEQGLLMLDVDFAKLPSPLNAPILPGDTWNFQAWHRDVNPTPTSNFTNGLRVTFE